MCDRCATLEGTIATLRREREFEEDRADRAERALEVARAMTPQQRYEAHQARKAETLARVAADTVADLGPVLGVMAARRSVRRFTREPVTPEQVAALHAAAGEAPTSCDRRGVRLVDITHRDDLALLGGLLVGGVGWIHRAPLVILLMADPDAYKAPGELDDIAMPKLDAGHAAAHIELAATALGLGSCFINPNIRERNRAHFDACFGPGVFCGAVAVGHPWPQ